MQRRHPKDLTGHRFGRLVVISRASATHPRGYTTWVCKCDCGHDKTTDRHSLVTGKVKSCGCLAAETFKQFTKHGMSRSTEYIAWCNMNSRCVNPSAHNYKNYGGRGVTVCGRWRHSFANFYADMGPRPSSKHSLERNDNDKGYDPSNCKWATAVDQQNNKRNSALITAFGRTQTTAQWAREVGMTHEALAQRVTLLKMSPEEALTRPLRKDKRRKP